MRRVWWIGFALLLIGPLLVAVAAGAQADLTGVIDIHAHSDPDSMPRSIDAIDLAKLAKQRGMRGLVLKNHYEPTASLASNEVDRLFDLIAELKSRGISIVYISHRLEEVVAELVGSPEG